MKVPKGWFLLYLPKYKKDDEIWDCWIAYSGSESEAELVCKSMEAVFHPLYAAL